MELPYIYVDPIDGQLKVDGVAVNTWEELIALAPTSAMCSSSVDFADEYTTDSNVLAMCKRLRG